MVKLRSNSILKNCTGVLSIMKFQDTVTRPVAVKSLQRIQPFEYGDLLVKVLNDYGVKYIFGIPGGGIEPLYNAMARSEKNGGLRTVVSRHESGAAFMADGYARESGKLGVCCTTTGPGATNIITGVASAYVDEVPMLVLTGQVRQANFGRGAGQDSSCDGVDIVSMLNHCTRYNSFVSHPDQLEEKLIKAISIATGSKPGPSHLSLPLDILGCPVESLDRLFPIKPFQFEEATPNKKVMNKLRKLIRDTKKAVLVLGFGAEIGATEIIEFAERNNWPLISTPMGKGLVSEDHPLYFGIYGLAGHSSAVSLLKDPSIESIIVIGSVLDEHETQSWDITGLLTDKLVHIDQNEAHFYRSSMAKLQVYGSPRLIFSELLNSACEGTPSQQESGERLSTNIVYQDELLRANVRMKQKIPPQLLFREISQKAPENTRVVVDIGNSFLWGIHYWQCQHKPGELKRLFRMGLGFAPMGWGIGAAVGTAIASPDELVVCFTGDGSLLMNGQEITTAAQEGLNILFVVLNDQCLGTVKHGQQLTDAEPTSFDLPSVSFVKLAQAFNIASHSIQNSEDLFAVDFDEIFNAPGPYLLEVFIDPEQIPPMGSRLLAINSAAGKE